MTEQVTETPQAPSKAETVQLVVKAAAAVALVAAGVSIIVRKRRQTQQDPEVTETPKA